MYSAETNCSGLLISAWTCSDHELMERYIIIWLCEVVSTRNEQKNGLWHHPMWKLNSAALAETCWNTAITTLLALKTANKISGKNSAHTQEFMAPATPSQALACICQIGVEISDCTGDKISVGVARPSHVLGRSVPCEGWHSILGTRVTTHVHRIRDKGTGFDHKGHSLLTADG